MASLVDHINAIAQHNTVYKPHKKNIKPSRFEIVSDEDNYWRALCEYGRVTLTSKEKLLRFTVSKKDTRAKHITCKYDKYGNFRVYYSEKTLKDITYQFVFDHNIILKKMLNTISCLKQSRDSLKAIEKFEKRFKQIFNISISPKEKRYGALFTFQEYIGRMVYPMSKSLIHKAPRRLSKSLRQHDAKQFTQEFFGSSPKTLVRTMGRILPLEQKHIICLFLSKVFFKIWPLEKVILFLEKTCNNSLTHDTSDRMYIQGEYSIAFEYFSHILEWRRFLKHFTCYKILNWVERHPNDFLHLLRDTVRQIQEIENMGKSVTISKKINLERLHDEVSRFYTRLKKKETPLPVYKSMYTLKNETIDDYDIVFPKTNHDLIEWGKYMNICVGSYDGYVTSGQSNIFSLQKNNKPIYCVEIFKYKNGLQLGQCKGMSNSEGPVEIKQKIIDKINNLEKKNLKIFLPEEHKIKNGINNNLIIEGKRP